MSFVVSGVTHCLDCGKPLNMEEFFRCSKCQKKYNQEREKRKFNLTVKKSTEIELAKMNKDIKTIILKNMNGEEKEYSGYWDRKRI